MGNVFTGGPSSARVDNPPSGAIIDYFLKDAPKDPVTLEILDSHGGTVRKFVNPGSPHAGMNRFVWNLYYAGPGNPEGTDSDLGNLEGPLALPGTYQVQLTAAGRTEKAQLTVKLDPRVNVSQGDLQKQFDLAKKMEDEIGKANVGVREMRDVHTQLQELRKRLANSGQAKDALAKVEDVDKQLSTLEESITGWKIVPTRYSLNYPPAADDKLTMLYFYFEAADGAPNQPALDVFQLFAGEIDSALAKWKALEKEGLAALNEEMRKENLPAIFSAPAK